MNSIENTECGLTGNMPIKNEKKLEKDIGKISGIYKIVNKVNGKYYVGSSLDIYRTPHGRFYQHKSHLKTKVHYNKHLQRAWNKYGENNFNFIVVENILNDIIRKELLEFEQKWLNIAKEEKNKCYNKSFTANGPDWNEETKRKRSELITGKNNPNYGNGDKITGNKNPFYGKKHTKEAKQKMSSSKRGKYFGCHSSQYKLEKFNFFNIKTNRYFYGTRYELYKSFKELKCPGVSQLVNKHKKSYKGWIIQ